MECCSVKQCCRRGQKIVLFVYMFKKNDLMYQCISNKLVFTRTQVLDSLLTFLILMYILTIVILRLQKNSPNITANMRLGSI